MTKNTVEITVAEYEELKKDSAHLRALKANGVDNWSGFVGSSIYCLECDEEYDVGTKGKCEECGTQLPDDDEGWY